MTPSLPTTAISADSAFCMTIEQRHDGRGREVGVTQGATRLVEYVPNGMVVFRIDRCIDRRTARPRRGGFAAQHT